MGAGGQRGRCRRAGCQCPWPLRYSQLLEFLQNGICLTLIIFFFFLFGDLPIIRHKLKGINTDLWELQDKSLTLGCLLSK